MNREPKYTNILMEVFNEIRRANEKHGTPDLRCVAPGVKCAQVTSYMNMPTSKEAREEVEIGTKYGRLTHADIVLEEFCEALEAMTDADRRTELVQVAATVVKWIDNIDRRKEKKKPECRCEFARPEGCEPTCCRIR